MLTGSAGSVLLLAGALLLWPGPGSRAAGRLHALRAVSPAGTSSPPVAVEPARSPRRRWLLPGVAGLATTLLMGGVPGLVAGAGVAVGVDRLLRGRTTEDPRRRQDDVVRDLPAACDLLAVCLTAGVPVGSALAAVGGAVPPPLGPQLRAVAGLYRLGAEPVRAWAAAPEALGPLGRLLVRAGESGASVAPGLRSLASDHRAEARAATETAVRRAGVWILAPLGLCFLPAFVCLGVVPLVLGIAADVLG